VLPAALRRRWPRAVLALVVTGGAGPLLEGGLLITAPAALSLSFDCAESIVIRQLQLTGHTCS
jgi:hypothetical protein